MTYEETLKDSALAYGQIKSAYAVLYNANSNAKSFSLQGQGKVINRRGGDIRNSTPPFKGIAVCTLTANTPLKDNSFIEVILTADAVKYIATLDKRAALRIAQDNFIVRVKPVAFDWVPCSSEEVIALLPPIVNKTERLSIEKMVQINDNTTVKEGTTTTVNKKALTPAEQKAKNKRNLGILVGLASLLLSK